MMKLIFWSFIAFCGLCHTIGSDNHNVAGVVLCLVLLPLISIRFVVTVAQGVWWSLRLLTKVF